MGEFMADNTAKLTSAVRCGNTCMTLGWVVSKADL